MEIARQEVLRYLGYRNQYIDQGMAKLIEECLAELKALMRKAAVYQIYPLEKKGDQIRLSTTNLVLQSKDLSKHLHYADQCVLLAATLGSETDQRLAAYSRLDLTRAIIMDACATAAIEALCDEVQNGIGEKVAKDGYRLTNRYSPGYGDLSISYQKAILEVLHANTRIGLTVNDDYILLPRKSVTAFIGLEKKEKNAPVKVGETKTGAAQDRCRRCLDKTCRYRKGGDRDEEKA